MPFRRGYRWLEGIHEVEIDLGHGESETVPLSLVTKCVYEVILDAFVPNLGRTPKALTQSVIARRLGLRRERVNRSIQVLVGCGLIDTRRFDEHHTIYVVPDMHPLYPLAPEPDDAN